MSIGVVVNPRAAGNRRPQERMRRLTELLGADGWVRETESVAALDAVAAEFRDRGVTVVAVCGGDGSFSRALTALARTYGSAPLPMVLPLRGGTMNTIARAVHAPRTTPERAVEVVVERARRHQPQPCVERDLLRINGDDFGFMIGAGTVVGFLRAYYAGRFRGPLGAAGLLGRLIVSVLTGGGLVRETFAWVDAKVSCEDRILPCDSFSVVYASSIDQIGLGFRPTYRAAEEPGRFHLVAGPLSTGEFLRCLPAMHRGQPTGSRQLFDQTARRVVVEFPRASPYMIDGDVLGAVSRLMIESGPRVRMIRE